MNKVKETFYSNFFDIGTEVNSALYQRNKTCIYLCLHCFQQNKYAFTVKDF